MSNIKETDGSYKDKQKKKIKTFLNLCKYDVLPAILTGGTISTLFTTIYTTPGVYDAFLFGGTSAIAFTLAVNAGITGIKYSKEEKQEALNKLETNMDEEEMGKKL